MDERNKVVIQDLQKQLFAKNPPKQISIFYGAGHMHDLEGRLIDELGYKTTDEQWLTAITLDLKQAGFRSRDLELIQGLAEMQLSGFQ